MTDFARFQALFEGNPDAHGRGDHNPYFLGGPPNWQAHLDHGGNAAVGIYPIRDNQVHWGCVDLDDPDLTPVYNLQQALAALDMYSTVELSKAKGYHVWVLLEEGTWVQAKYMRRALLVACQIAEASAKEVNPKQEELADGQVGNYVRLPYPNRGAGGRQVFGIVDAALGHPRFTPLSLEQGLDQAEADRNYYTSILNAADLWKPPERHKIGPIAVDLHDAIERGLPASVTLRLENLPLTRRVMEEGDGYNDRSRALYHLAGLAKDSSFTPSEVLQILIEADLTWAHKYIERDHSDKQLRRIVQQVFG